MQGVEARKHARATAKIRVDYHYKNTIGVGHTTDISEGGLFLHCEPVPAVGTRIYLKICVPDEPEPLKVIGRVMRVVERGPRESGAGVHFEVAYSRIRGSLGEFMDALLADEGGERLSQHEGSMRRSMYGAAVPPGPEREDDDGRGEGTGRVVMLVALLALVVAASYGLATLLGGRGV